MINEGYVSRGTSPIMGLIIGEVSLKTWLHFVSVSMSVSSSYLSELTEAASGRHFSALSSKALRNT